MRFLNLGCGTRYHSGWTNVDFVSTGPGVIAHNLLKGIPFQSNEFDLVYHSHVLEHFSRNDGKAFITECHRVLKKDGIIRIAVPDLEGIARQYIDILDRSLKGDDSAIMNYDWILLELFDQTVRNEPGGDMLRYLLQKELPNEDFVFQRLGEEAKKVRDRIKSATPKTSEGGKPSNVFLKFKLLFSWTYLKHKARNFLFKEDIEALKIGKFRTQGETHLWMYDRFSLQRLLLETGFKSVKLQTASESYLKGWSDFHLDTGNNGKAFKPDSIYMEGIK